MIDKGGSVYKIRDRSTGLYSTGGGVPRFRKGGKVWNGLGPLRQHLRIQEGYGSRKREIPESWEVVEFSLKAYDSSTVVSARSIAAR